MLEYVIVIYSTRLKLYKYLYLSMHLFIFLCTDFDVCLLNIPSGLLGISEIVSSDNPAFGTSTQIINIPFTRTCPAVSSCTSGQRISQ